MFHLNNKKNNRAGYTLTELLVAVAIIAVLAAIAFVVAPGYIRRLKQMQLDKSAETIYYAVQNRLTELRTSGRSEEYQLDDSTILAFSENYEFLYAGDVEQPPMDQMAYFDAEANGHGEKTSVLLPRDRVDETLWAGRWVVEFNYESATVWGVFYIDDSGMYNYAPGDKDNPFNTLRDFDNRLQVYDEYKVGYYGKGTALLHPDTVSYEPEVTIVNKEELYAELSCDAISGVSDTKVTFCYKLWQLNSDGSKDNGVDPTEFEIDGSLDGNTFKATVILDSLKKDGLYRFCHLFSDYTPGADMLLEVYVKSSSTGKSDSVESEKFNSLFADETNIANKTAKIQYGRHLQNLNTDTSAVNLTQTTITSAEMIADISFKDDSPWYDVFQEQGKAAITPPDFVPIYNQKLNSFNGDGHKITRLKSTGVSVLDDSPYRHLADNAGLFSTFCGTSITALTLETPIVQNGNSQDGAVGLLAGKLRFCEYNTTEGITIEGITITNDLTLTDEYTPTATGQDGNVGGLIGTVCIDSDIKEKTSLTIKSTTIDSVSVTAGDIENTSSGSAGGLIGEISDSDYLTVSLEKIVINKPKDTIANKNQTQQCHVESYRNNAGGIIGTSSAKLYISNEINKSAELPIADLYDIQVYTDVAPKDHTKGSAGGVVGYVTNEAHIDNVSFHSVNVVAESSDLSSSCAAGGVVGSIFDLSTTASSIHHITFSEGSFGNKVSVSSNGPYAGGLVGWIKGGSDSRVNIYSIDMDDVSATAQGAVGGFIGALQSPVTIGVDPTSYVSAPCSLKYSMIQGDASNSGSDDRMGNAGGLIGEVGVDASGNGGTTVSYCNLSNVTVSSPKGSAGGFVGISKSTFSSSQITNIDSIVTSPSRYAGGFVGELAGGNPSVSKYHFHYSSKDKCPVITYTYNDNKKQYEFNPTDSAIAGSLASGGLIGAITSGKPTIELSYASTVIGYYADNNTYSEYSGGLIGLLSSADCSAVVTKSYADSYVFGANVGGLFGVINSSESNPSIQYCYAAGYLFGTTKQAGLAIGKLTTIGTNYTVCYPKTEGSYYCTAEGITASSKTYYLYGNETTPKGIKIGANWLQGMDNDLFVNAMNSIDAGVFSKTTSTVKYNMNWWVSTESKYPYPQIAGISNLIEDEESGTYGDWHPYNFKAQFVYFETSDDINFTVAYYDAELGIDLSSLSDVALANGDGYGILSETWDTGWNSGTSTFELVGVASSGTLSDPIKVNVTAPGHESMELSLRILLPKYSEATDSRSENDPVIYEGKCSYEGCYGRIKTDELLQFNPSTAKSIVKKSTDEITEFSIRSPRQLWILSNTYDSYSKRYSECKFTQGLDLDYSEYFWSSDRGYTSQTSAVLKQRPIGGTGSSTTAFDCTYDGNYHEIRNLSFYASANGAQTGLFAQVGGYGNIVNVFLVNKYDVSASCDPAIYIGVLAGQVLKGQEEGKGKVSNCAVCGYALTINVSKANEWWYIGGLVGQNSGEVSSCSVSTRKIHVISEYNKDPYVSIGGLVGHNTETGKLENSYAIGIIGLQYISSIASSHVSGFVGYNEGLCSGYCYCMVGTEILKHETLIPGGTWYGFTINTGNYDSSGSYFYLNNDNLVLYGSDRLDYKQTKIIGMRTAKGTAQTLKQMSQKSPTTKSRHSCESETEEIYPFKAVVQSSSGGSLVHYGDWPRAVSTLASFSLAVSQDSLTLNEGEKDVIYVTATDDETGETITEYVSLRPTVTSSSSDCFIVDEEPMADNDIDPSTGKTIGEMTGDEGDYPGAVAFQVEAVSSGTATIQIEQVEESDDTSDTKTGNTKMTPEILQHKSDLKSLRIKSIITSPDSTGFFETKNTISNVSNLMPENDLAEDGLVTDSGSESQEEGNNNDVDYQGNLNDVSEPMGEETNQEQSALDSDCESDTAITEDNSGGELDNIEESLDESSSGKIYILSEPLILQAKAYKESHIGIFTSTYDDILLSNLCPTVTVNNDISFGGSDEQGVYPNESSVIGTYSIRLPLNYWIENEDKNDNTNLFLYFACDELLEESTLNFTIENVTVIRHLKTDTEQSELTYELYNRDSSEEDSWMFDDYFFKYGNTVYEQEDGYNYAYLPITFTGRYEDPVTITVVIGCGDSTYHLTCDLEKVQNSFHILLVDGFFTLRDFELNYGDAFALPAQEDVKQIVAALDDAGQQQYQENQKGYIYPVIDEEKGETIWTPNQLIPVYEDCVYEVKRKPVSYTISFSANGGDGAMDILNATYDELIDLPACLFTKEGYSFMGWALAADADEAEFPDESSVYCLSDVENGEVILYALWEKSLLSEEEKPDDMDDDQKEDLVGKDEASEDSDKSSEITDSKTTQEEQQGENDKYDDASALGNKEEPLNGKETNDFHETTDAPCVTEVDDFSLQSKSSLESANSTDLNGYSSEAVESNSSNQHERNNSNDEKEVVPADNDSDVKEEIKVNKDGIKLTNTVDKSQAPESVSESSIATGSDDSKKKKNGE